MSDLETAGAVAEFALMELAYPWPWWMPVALFAAGITLAGLLILLSLRRRRPAGAALRQQREPRG